MTPPASPPAARATRSPVLPPVDAALYAAARLRAARMQPYLASAVYSLVPVASPGLGTFAVDRWWRVYVDMDRAREWGVEASAAVLLHEAHHVLRDHHRRAQTLGVTATTHRRWNLAADAAINDDLVAAGLPLPDPVLPAHLGVEHGGMEEAYYRALEDRSRSQGAASSPECGSGSGGATLDVELPDDDGDQKGSDDGDDGDGVGKVDGVDAEAVRRGVAHAVAGAVAAGQQVSPGLARWAAALLAPQVPWRSVLRSAVGRAVRVPAGRPEPTWTRPNRRADPAGVVLSPGVRRRRAHVAVVVDTSASMTEPLLDAAVTEIDSIVRRCAAEVSVVVCDVTAAAAQRVRRLSSLRLTGGGGTDMRVGIDACAALQPRPDVIVVLTDGDTPWPAAAPPRMPMVAVVIGAHAPLPEGSGITAVRIDAP